MRALLADEKTPAGQRKDYLTALLAARDKDLVPVLQKFLKEPGLRTRGEAGDADD